MGRVITSLTMSLDGFIAGVNDGPELPLGEHGERLFAWYGSGDTELTAPNGQMTVRVSPASAAMLRDVFGRLGALVTGRRTFDITDGWGGRHTLDVPVFVVTHSIPHAWIAAHPEAPFTFVTEGVERAVALAREVAGDRDVAVGAASIIQQCLKVGLLDELQVDLMPILLGRGVRFFDDLGGEPIQLERTMVIEAPDVTHLRFRVVR